MKIIARISLLLYGPMRFEIILEPMSYYTTRHIYAILRITRLFVLPSDWIKKKGLNSSEEQISPSGR